jgi:hypothetical protein
MPTFPNIGALRPLVGQEVGVSDWFSVTQEMNDSFAAVTQDRQWIHCDHERARRESPFGATVAHGFLTLALFGTGLQAGDDIGLRCPRRDHDQIGLFETRRGPDTATNLDTVHFRHHPVEQCQLRWIGGLENVPGLAAVAGDHHVVTYLPEFETLGRTAESG